jgi:hypothetical protein
MTLPSITTQPVFYLILIPLIGIFVILFTNNDKLLQPVWQSVLQEENQQRMPKGLPL